MNQITMLNRLKAVQMMVEDLIGDIMQSMDEEGSERFEEWLKEDHVQSDVDDQLKSLD